MILEKIYGIFLDSKRVCIDTKKLEKGDIFFCLKGENNDGNKFSQEAINKGAMLVVSDNEKYRINNKKQIFVKDCLKTLQLLSSFHRSKLNLKIIAITGSNGKTTSKDLTDIVLSSKFKVKKTFGNLNNHIGVPLTLLNFDSNTEIGIVEMGANHIGEINFLCEIAKPTHGVITNFGKAHLEGFGSVNGIIKAKKELYTYLLNNNGMILINNDDSNQKKIKDKPNVYSYGTSDETDFKFKKDNKSKFLKFNFNKKLFETSLTGDYNYNNLFCAVSFGKYFGIDNNKIENAIKKFIPQNNRSQIIKYKSTNIFMDSYNANPTSMILSLKSFLKNNKNNRLIILGDMLELGRYSIDEHQKIVNFLSNIDIYKIILIGNFFLEVNSNKKFIKFATTDQAISYLNKEDFNNKNIFVKGSRSNKLEKILDVIN
tara:strand:+ start:602 stop:1885 length:1284 start_codon:yes stop_codon:yes gene_type:complete